ncbi:MAG: ABC transporter substrate-binding protein [Myxococcota bacterium]
MNVTPLRPASAVAILLLAACADAPRPVDDGVVVVAQETQASFTRNFNPLLPGGTSRWPTRAGVYEPLAIFDSLTGEWVPWLATSWGWEAGNRVLRFEVREGVRWSDGEPFTADDVVFTFELMRKSPALDPAGVWKYLDRVVAPDDHTVVFYFGEVFVPGFDDLAQLPLVPRHVWQDVEDPLAFANPDPVGTGPFTEVRLWTPQVFELGKNPNYWQPLGVEAIRMPAFAGNDAANLALVAGEVDWAGNFVPAAERTFEAVDPEHRDFWSPPVEATVFLYANTTKAPFDDPRVRKALSMAIDRDLLVQVAMYDYTHPADATGLSDAAARWKDPGIGRAWTVHDPGAAADLLREAGVDEVSVELLAVAGWSDWIRAANVIARDLEAVGLDVDVRTPDFNGWFDSVQRGTYDLAIGWSTQGPTPYAFFRDVMGSETVKPVGEPSPGNWHRWGSPAADVALARMERTSDPDELADLATELQRLFLEEAPAIPLFPAPAWGAANHARFEGFPSAADPWAALSPNRAPESLLVLTHLRSR